MANIDYSRLTNDAAVVEILSAADKLKTKKEKIDILRKYSSRADLMAVLRGAYAKNIEWAVPIGDLPEGRTYSSAPSIDTADDRMIRAYKQFIYLIKGGPAANMMQSKREQVYLDLLSSMHIDEAKLLQSIVQKKLPYKGITAAIVAEAFPAIWPKETKESKSA
jgi:hypothetical protein|tara:strand:- start:537 stop:1028 length:492 start_codon:yes stop_codon:yes gene_type:complete